MEVVVSLIQVIIAVGILNVWLLRFNKATEWRGKDAGNMKEEFAAYGLPEAAVYIVGFFKVLFAAMLLVGLVVPTLVVPAAGGLGLLMLGAIIMHVKVGDPPKKSLPASIMLVLCGLLLVL